MSLMDKRKQMAKPFYEVRPELRNPPTYDNETYIGPSWMREGICVNQPMRDRQLIEDEAVKRMVQLDERESRTWLLLMPAMICLGCAAWLFHVIWQAMR